MNLADLPWEQLEIDLRRAGDVQEGQRTSIAHWSALSTSMAAFLHSATLLRAIAIDPDESFFPVLTELGFEVTTLFPRLHRILPAIRTAVEMMRTVLSAGTLDAAVSADTWTWDGIRGVNLQLIDHDALPTVRKKGQALLRWVATCDEPPPLAEVLAKLRGQRGSGLILRWTTQTFALIPGFCIRRGLPTLGQPANAQVTRSRRVPVRPMDHPLPDTGELGASLVEDITAMISEIALQPVRHRHDWAWKVVDAKRIAARISGSDPSVSAEASERLNKAFDCSQLLSLTTSKALLTEISNEGLAWLRHSAGERHKLLLKRLRPYLTETPATLVGEDYPAAHLLHRAIARHLTTSDYLSMWNNFSSAWRELGSSAWMRSEALDWWRRHPPTDQPDEAAWGRLVVAALTGLAQPLGIITGAGVGENRTVHLTPAGRWALGLDESWAPPVAISVAKPIIVQADHTIIFLAPDAALEVALGAFCDRIPGAQGTGVLFKLSKAACRRGAIAGLDATVVTAVLARASSKPLPTNVVRELEGWFGRLRRASARHAVVITTADEETAGTLVTLLGAVRLGPLAVSLPPDLRPADLERRVAKAGILLDISAIPRRR